MQWPGYRQDPSEQRMSTAEGLISRENLLLAVAEYVYQFTEEIRVRAFGFPRRIIAHPELA